MPYTATKYTTKIHSNPPPFPPYPGNVSEARKKSPILILKSWQACQGIFKLFLKE